MRGKNSPKTPDSELTKEVDADGFIYWWDKTGFLHRDFGPAYQEPDGHKEWIRHGKTHCEDGPAIIYPNGTLSWRLMGYNLVFDDWCKKLNKTPEEILILKLKYNC